MQSRDVITAKIKSELDVFQDDDCCGQSFDVRQKKCGKDTSFFLLY